MHTVGFAVMTLAATTTFAVAASAHVCPRTPFVYSQVPTNKVFAAPNERRVEEIAAHLPEKPGWYQPYACSTGRLHEVLGKAVVPLTDEEYTQFFRDGNRSNYEDRYHDLENRLVSLAAAASLWGRQAPEYPAIVAKAAEIISVFVNFKSWVEPAHDPNRGDLWRGKLNRIDLGSSRLSASLAFALLMLEADLPPELSAQLRSELKRRTFDSYLHSAAMTTNPGSDPYHKNHWFYLQDNWNAVCHAFCVQAALAAIDDRLTRARFIEAAERALPYYLAGFYPDGYCFENGFYWDYGFGNFLRLTDVVRNATGGFVDFSKLPTAKGLMLFGYATNMDEKSGRPLFADGGGGRSKRQWLELGAKFWPELKAEIYGQLPIRTFFPAAQVYLGRAEGMAFAIKGGQNNLPHCHHDLGSWNLVTNGICIAGDPGGEVYTRRTFSPQRFESKILNSYGHPVPRVNGELQEGGGKSLAWIEQTAFTEAKDVVVYDLTDGYRALRGGEGKLLRTVIFDRVGGCLEIRDDFSARKPMRFDSPVIFRVAENPLVPIVPEGKWHLEKDDIENPGRATQHRHSVTFDEPVTNATVIWTFTAARQPGLEVSVPFALGLESNFEQGVSDLLRLRREFGVKRIFAVGCPGSASRIAGWNDDDAPFERFADLLARTKAAVAPTGLEIGWWNAPTLACAKGGPFQFMVGHTGKTALHSPCPLDEKFVSAFCRRMRIVAGKAKPAAILFEDDLHFKSQRDQTNDGWTGPCCYCPLHLAALAKKCGRRYTREELLDKMNGDTAEARELKAQFEETLAESMAAFGRRIRSVIDEVSPATVMGMSAVGNLAGNKGADLAFAQAVAGAHQPFVRISSTIYDSNGSLVSMLDMTVGSAFWDFHCCPRGFKRIHEMDTYPHNRFYMPDAMVSALMAYSVSLGAEGFLFYGSQYLDDPLEANGYFPVLKRERPKLEALQAAIKGKHLIGVRAIGREPNLVPIAARYGIALAHTGIGPAMLVGNAPNTLTETQLQAEVRRGGFVLDGKAAAELTRRGYREVLGAKVTPCAPLPAVGERILPGVDVGRYPGRNIYNNNFAAATSAEKCDFYEVAEAEAGMKTLVAYVDSKNREFAPSVYRHEAASGIRSGVIATTLPGNRSAALFNLRKREVLIRLLEWTAKAEIPVRITDEPNVAILANADDAESEMILTIVNLRADVIDSLKLTLSRHWLSATAEEVDAKGQWRPVAMGTGEEFRERRLPGEFRPGVSRIFRLRLK